MVATTGRPELLPRFDRGERLLHWVNAALFLTLLLTGATLYVGQLSQLVGRRHLVEMIHVVCGLALPVPLLLTVLSGPWGRGFRADVRRLNRFSADDKRWLRTRGRDRRVRLGRFNPGQKLNAAFTGGAIVVMLATGSIMYWPNVWPLAWRTGATFVHDWLFLALVLTIAGHIMFAVNDPSALRAMVRGTISRRWARAHAPRWFEELTGEPASGGRASGGPASGGGGLPAS